MSHLEALEEVIKYQKEKLAIQEAKLLERDAKILQLEKDLAEEKAKPKLDYTAYLEKQKTCEHEYENNHGFGILQALGRKCKKCDYYDPGIYTNQQPWFGSQQLANCIHEYPENWQGLLPPSCKKCGKLSPSWYTTTYGNIPNNPNITTSGFTSGYFQPNYQQQTFIGAQQGNLALVPEEDRNKG